jgi:hypothetical protein
MRKAIILSEQDREFLQRLLTKIKRASIAGGTNTSTSLSIPARGGESEYYIPYFTARIRDSGPDGESDFDDERYWFEAVYNSNPDTDKDVTSPLEWEAFEEEFGLISNASNLAEMIDQTHTLPVDRIIDVIAVPAANGTIRYYFDAGGAGGITPGEEQYDVYQMIAQNEPGWDKIRFH